MMNVKDARRAAAQKAREKGYSISAIAREIGAKPSNVRMLLKRGGDYSPWLKPLDEWLQRNGFWVNETAATYSASKLSPLNVVAGRLRALAEYLDQPDISPETRVEELAASVKSLHDRMAELVSASQKFTEKGGVE